MRAAELQWHQKLCLGLAFSMGGANLPPGADWREPPRCKLAKEIAKHLEKFSEKARPNGPSALPTAYVVFARRRPRRNPL